MHQIYKNATNVRIWLGNDDQSIDIHAALALMSHCLTMFEQVRGRGNSKLESDWNIFIATSWKVVFRRAFLREMIRAITEAGCEYDFETLGARYVKEGEKEPITQKIDWHSGSEYSSGWKAIKNILTRSYFTRSWIIQEMVLSSNRSMFIGDYDVTDILRFVELLYQNPEIKRQLPSECFVEPKVIWRTHHLIRGIVECRGNMNLGYLLATFRG
ncbi:hypothetical protein DSL72_008192 [Monilinia vaccinii-corymbosi]|uniref:Heterokaryon incompatibility domain-containing protein n=1 Tax=Monilinia vaccinii-corymbosi TaxID=61207 RepID=A0A8A3PJX9_9HELO|nr:hypothetical protein DSL72_008192 [Monilinia vaccinii-corymbosi]